jgi:hypothetical protein
MSCDCETYTCLDAFYNPCSEGVELNVIPDYTGNMTGRVWFNGTIKSFGIEVTEGEKIIIPNILNESYTHDMRLYDEDGTLIACYKVKTAVDTELEEFTPTPASASGLMGNEFTGNGTDTQTFAGLNGYELLTVEMASGSYTSDFWVQNGGEVVLNAPQTFIGQIVLTWK